MIKAQNRGRYAFTGLSYKSTMYRYIEHEQDSIHRMIKAQKRGRYAFTGLSY
jgi:hypothetical protein